MQCQCLILFRKTSINYLYFYEIGRFMAVLRRRRLMDRRQIFLWCVYTTSNTNCVWPNLMMQYCYYTLEGQFRHPASTCSWQLGWFSILSFFHNNYVTEWRHRSDRNNRHRLLYALASDEISPTPSHSLHRSRCHSYSPPSPFPQWATLTLRISWVMRFKWDNRTWKN